MLRADTVKSRILTSLVHGEEAASNPWPQKDFFFKHRLFGPGLFKFKAHVYLNLRHWFLVVDSSRGQSSCLDRDIESNTKAVD